MNAWKIMVVDDEPKIRRGLCRLVEGLQLPLAICAQAADGEEAVALALEHKPDIVLLDINMPHMDGLAFLSTLRQHGIASKCILITGFDEFAYAQASVALKAHAYLLKPVNLDELQRHLRSAIDELNVQSERHQIFDTTMNQIQRNRQSLQQSFVKKWLGGHLHGKPLQEHLSFWQIAFPEKAHLLVAQVDLHKRPIYQQSDRKLMLFAVDNIMGEWLGDPVFHAHDEHAHSFAILPREPDEALCRQLEAQIDSALDLPCTAMGDALATPDAMQETFVSLCKRIAEAKKSHDIVDRAKSEIAARLGDPNMSLVEVAGSIGISSSYLSRLLKQHLNVSFSEYVTQQRIGKALRLLQDPRTKIASIANDTGYANQHYFSTAFKKTTGLTPTQYREKEGY